VLAPRIQVSTTPSCGHYCARYKCDAVWVSQQAVSKKYSRLSFSDVVLILQL
jgi:hypothetical protein